MVDQVRMEYSLSLLKVTNILEADLEIGMRTHCLYHSSSYTCSLNSLSSLGYKQNLYIFSPATGQLSCHIPLILRCTFYKIYFNTTEIKMHLAINSAFKPMKENRIVNFIFLCLNNK